MNTMYLAGRGTGRVPLKTALLHFHFLEHQNLQINLQKGFSYWGISIPRTPTLPVTEILNTAPETAEVNYETR